MAAFAERLKELRKGAGLTQSALAERLNVHLQTVSKWERGITEPDISQLGDLSAALGVTLERLVGGAEGEETFSGTFDAAAFGKALSELRRARGEHQEDIAALFSTAADTVSKWERGVTCPDVGQLAVLAEHFSLPVSKLYFAIGDVRTETPVEARRRRRISFAWLGGAAVLGVSAIVCAAILPGALGTARPVFTVTVDGAAYEVTASDWFTPAPASRTGYDFVGYADESGALVDFPVCIEEDASFTAVFAPHEYAVDYWLNGGCFTDAPQDVLTMESGAITLSPPEKQGAQFLGWYLTPDYAGEPVGSISCTAEDVTLYARWSDDVYTVRYELGGGILSEGNPAAVTRAEEVVLAEPTRLGYLFLGWYDAPEGGNRVTSVGGADARNLTLYALWQESGARWSVRYEACGGDLPEGNPASVGAGEVCVLSDARRTGYDFVGWNDCADGSGTWYERLSGVAGDLTLYAVWSPKIYTVRYELNGGGYGETGNPNYITYGESVTLAPAFKYGHTFLGWYDAPEGGEPVGQITPENVLSLSTLYARFAPVEYTVRLIGAGGTMEADGEQLSEQTFALFFGDTFPLPDCVRAGFEFLGWYDEAGTRYTMIDVTNVDDLTLTAQYREAGLTYTVEYVLSGGTLSEENPAKVGYGQAIMLHAPERYGYLFLGWNDRPDGSGTYYTATPTERETALTLYAVWQEIVTVGSADNFLYEKGQASVTITGYTGAFGENVDLVLPAYIDGLPVVATRGTLAPAEAENTLFRLRSVTLPETLLSLGERTFYETSVAEPIVIPARVQEIGEECFFAAYVSIGFAPGSALAEIKDCAFQFAHIENIVTLPEGLVRLGGGAFSSAYLRGLILPASLREIGGSALGVNTLYAAQISLPSGVTEIGANAFCPLGGSPGDVAVYTALTSEEAAFTEGWANGATVAYSHGYSGVTLDCGGETTYLAGQAVALPVPDREGFVGWYDAQTGEFAAPLYIPQREGAVLRAVFSDAPGVGSSSASPALLGWEEERTVTLSWQTATKFYFRPPAGSGRMRLMTSGGVLQGYPLGDRTCGVTFSVGDTVFQSVPIGISCRYEEDTVYCVSIPEEVNYCVTVTFRLEQA